MICRFRDIPSGHLTPETWTWLDNQFTEDNLRNPTNEIAAYLAGGRTRHGWFVYAPEDALADIPADLAAVLRTARTYGAEYILLDCDAVPNQDLPVLHPDFAGVP
jgi:hypothetical protein